LAREGYNISKTKCGDAARADTALVKSSYERSGQIARNPQSTRRSFKLGIPGKRRVARVTAAPRALSLQASVAAVSVQSSRNSRLAFCQLPTVPMRMTSSARAAQRMQIWRPLAAQRSCWAYQTGLAQSFIKLDTWVPQKQIC